MPGPYATQETPGSDLPQQPPDLGSDAPQQGGGHQHGGGGDQTGPKDYEQTGDPQQQYPVYKMPPPPPPPPKDSPHGVCIYTPKDPKDPSKGGNYFYPKDPNDPSQGGTYYTVSPGGQQTSIATQSTAGTKSSTELTSTTQTPAGAGSSTGLSLENDLFLIGGDLISRLLGNVTSIKLENASDKEVTVQVVIGYDTVDTENSEY